MLDAISKEAIEQELGEARERLRALETEVTRLQRVIANLTGLLAAKFGEGTPLQAIPLFDGATPVGKGRFANLSIKEGIRIILQERGEPIVSKEILFALEAGGKKVGGKRKLETIRSILKRNKQTFARDGKRGWTLSGLYIKEAFNKR